MARELAPAGVRSAPKSGTSIHLIRPLAAFATAAQPSGSKLPRHKSAFDTALNKKPRICGAFCLIRR
ncbi:hypothetical protein C1X69_25665 [Pseudomonas sp. FW305-67]|nr:hypothetical protein C1X70_26395 [Pseudomonas sp. FW305-53]PMY84609.1 hypothetical protein C1X68_23495 [Pseudomonas sp. FW303-C2]PMY90166.1 hypothetical protein C1X67_25210 [Pseudomonas sp. FW305-62]PNA43943.1 hypothetical protein C1X71_10425 [Pseudomonas sp. FW306-2-2C-A10BC]PNA86373.1 hypothetical protein C1X66_12275 [Pseudomonas sp. MPR-R3B]PNB14093.1 hypothetical protein C1X69_25665 [Pseudomonas sp. FW305-67]